MLEGMSTWRACERASVPQVRVMVACGVLKIENAPRGRNAHTMVAAATRGRHHTPCRTVYAATFFVFEMYPSRNGRCRMRRFTTSVATSLTALCAALVATLLFGGWAARAETSPDLAAIRALQAKAQWAVSESLATVALTTLDRQPAPDSLAIAEASYLFGVAHMRNSGYADGVALTAATRSRDIRARRLGARSAPVA